MYSPIPCVLSLFLLSPPPLHLSRYSCLENPMDGGAWCAAVHGVARSQTRLSNLTFTFHFHVLEKEMATHSCVIAWRIPGSGEPDGLRSLGSHRVRHAWSDLAAAAVAAGHRRVPSWVPCAIQLLPTSYVFYTPFPSLPCPLIHYLCLHLYSCPENRLIYTIFLDSIHMH